MTVQEKAELIIKDIKSQKGKNPIRIFKKIETIRQIIEPQISSRAVKKVEV